MNECTIVTNDEDFFHLLQVHGFPPKVVLIRTGNQSTGFIADILVKYKEKIEAMINSKEYGLMEVY